MARLWIWLLTLCCCMAQGSIPRQGSSGPMAAANLYRFSSKEVHPGSGFYYYG